MEASAKARYTALAMLREAVLKRARKFSAITIPSLLPPEGSSQNHQMIETEQSFGARAVTSLSSRIMTAILPPNQSSFEFRIPPEVMLQAGADDVDSDTEKGLSSAQILVHQETERQKWRAPTFLEMQHLIVAGNVMEQILPDNKLRLFRLDQYVCVRNPNGDLIEFVIEENLHKASLPDNLRAMIEQPLEKDDTPSDTLALYTWGKYDAGEDQWVIHQEFMGGEVGDSRGTYKINPYNALRWMAVIGEDYGRSKVEEHYGDFKSLEGLAGSVNVGAAMAARHVTLIRPNAAGGINLHRKLRRAENGDMLVANPEDVSMLQFANNSGMETARQEKEVLRQELGAGFLMNSAARRDAERVTKFELRMMIEEIESVLGGVYSSLAQDMMEHRIKRLILQMKAQKKLPEWPDGFVEPVVLTGLEALGREREVEAVSTALQFLNGLPPEVVSVYVKWPELIKKAFNGLNLPDTYNTEDEAQEIAENRARAQALSRPATAAPAQGEGE